MADHLGMAAQLVGQSLRLGWYFGLTRLMERQAAAHAAHQPSPRPPFKPTRPVPTLRELLADLGQLLLADALAVRDGLYPPMEEEAAAPLDHLARVRAMLADLPRSMRRRAAGDAREASRLPEAEGLPDYFTQDFHFQSGGYLTADSARLYDVQLETLFFGAGAPMRRAALRPIAGHLRGRDQRHVQLLDVACGTGRFLGYVRRAWPAIQLTGLDLSRAYLDEAATHLAGRRPVTWLAANAEAIPLADASQDIVTCIFLCHELPPEVRRRVAAEMARVLRPGGLLVLIDSLQMGDRPGWDGLLEAFPHRFHEPYYRHYAIDDLDGMLAAAGLTARATSTAFLAKLMVSEKV